MLKLYAGTDEISLPIEDKEDLSMLIEGKSRMGKTFFASLLGSRLITEGNVVHLIDLGSKWSCEDKEKLIKKGAILKKVAVEQIEIPFARKIDIVQSAKWIVDALGMRSLFATNIIRDSIKQLLEEKGRVELCELIECIEVYYTHTQNKYAEKILMYFATTDILPKFAFILRSKDSLNFSKSIIWDLENLDKNIVSVISNIIIHAIYCDKKNIWKSSIHNGKTFVIIDEFHTLGFNQHGIIGTVLTEGQKYENYLILITQFLQGKFNETLINQLRQGGYCISFRMTAEETAIFSKQFCHSYEQKKIIMNQMRTIPVGKALLQGEYRILTSNEILDNPIFIEIKDE